MELKKFSDFANEIVPLDGDKIKIDDIINKEIIVIGYRVKSSKYGRSSNPDCLTIQFLIDNKKFIFFTGSSVLLDQINKYKNEIPFSTTVKKINRFYTFT
jgi:hypothetical protein